MDVIRRILPRRMLYRDQYSFELLKSSSNQDFRARSLSNHGKLPRFYSNYENIRLTEAANREKEEKGAKVGEVRLVGLDQVAELQKSEEVIDYIGIDEMKSTCSMLIGFVASEEDSNGQPGCSYRFSTEDPTYEKAISECHVIRENKHFSEGILLKCTDKLPLYSYMHIAQFNTLDQNQRINSISSIIRECEHNPKSCYGVYNEIYAIQKTSSEQQLPSNRHSGYIIIAFKLLDDARRQQNLEKTWLSWSGAREIYKYSPRNWNLRKVSLMRHHNAFRSGSNPFVYILLCEYGSILHPSNTIQAMDMCERLRVRNCGHIALYQVHTSYGSPNPVPPMQLSPATVRSRNTAPPTSMKQNTGPAAVSAASKRALMMSRGFSHDVENTIQPERRINLAASPKRNPMNRGTSQDVSECSFLDDRRARLRQHRETSFTEEHYGGYQNY